MTKKFFLLVTLSSLLNAQAIQTGLPFLKLGIGARSIAMGEAFTAVGNDQSSSSYNPALSRMLQSNEIMLMHKQWIEETSTEYFGATVRGEEFHYGISILSTSVPDIQVRTRPGDEEGTFTSRNFMLGLSASTSISENINIGVSGKFLYEKIFIDEATGYGIDFGALYKVDNNWSIGSSILNAGSMNKLRSESSRLPTTFRVGTSYLHTLSKEFSTLGAADVTKTFNDNLIHINVGAELSYSNLIWLRAGYQTGYEFKSFSTGFGVRYEIVKFDYAFVPFTGALASSHTFSLSFVL